jgi:hypothetical protein
MKNLLRPLEEERKHPLLFNAHKLRGSGKDFLKTRAADEDMLDRMLPFLVCQHLPGHWSQCHWEPLLPVVQQDMIWYKNLLTRCCLFWIAKNFIRDMVELTMGSDW